MTKVLLFIVLITLSYGIVLFPPSETPGTFKSFFHSSQIDSCNLWPDIWMKNYSILGVTSACPPVLTDAIRLAAPGKVIVTSFNENSSPCSLQQLAAAYAPANPVALLVWSSFPARSACCASDPNKPPTNAVPVIHIGARSDLPFSLAFTDAFFPLGVFFDANGTLLLDFPSNNPVIRERTTSGGWGQLVYFSLVMGLLGMLIAAAKLAIFIQHEGIRFNIPQIVMACCFVSSMFVFINGGLFGNSNLNNQGIVSVDVQEGTFYLYYGFTMTALLILGFYFGEVARLTSAQSVPGLDKLLIPAIIFVVINWAVVLANCFFFGVDPPSAAVEGVELPALFNFFFAWLAVINPFVISCILVWGIISLVGAFSGSGNKGPIIRIVVTSVACLLFYWGFGLGGFIVFFEPGVLGASGDDVFAGYSLIEFNGLKQLLFVLAYIPINIILCLNFSVSVQKDIDVSKSATSSTSGVSSSKSSSSSSSNADPVIEL